MPDDGRSAIDPRIDSPGREGLTGTTPGSTYLPLRDRETITTPPDGRSMDAQPVWRKDFPIDWPQDIYIERRDFTKFMVLTSLAFVVGQFWIAGENWLRRRRARPPLTKIGELSQIQVGTTQTFNYPTETDPCLLIRPAPNVLLAYGQKCTHLSCAVIPDVPGGKIRCPCHDGLFDLQTGRPLAGPPRRPLTRVRLELQGDDIYAAGLEARTT
jgi:Rieske Fe-S protein